jgi:hypothetical protein
MCNLGAINEQAAQEYLQYVNTCRASESAKAARDLTEAKKYRIDTCSKR